MSTTPGEGDYRRGAFERLQEAYILLNRGLFCGSVYLGGRAVEGMLRALIWRNDPDVRAGRTSLDTGHDLRRLLDRVSNLGVLGDYERRDQFAGEVQNIGRLWFNNLRFLPTEKLRQHWWKIGEISPRRSLKQAVGDYYIACNVVVRRCEALCQN